MMEFLKKNWSKILLSIGGLALAIVVLVPLLQSPKFNFIGFAQSFGFILFFLGIAIYYVLKMFSATKLYAICTLLLTGVLTITFLGIGMAGFAKSDKAEGAFGNAYAYYTSGVVTTAIGKATQNPDSNALASQLSGITTLKQLEAKIAELNGVANSTSATEPQKSAAAAAAADGLKKLRATIVENQKSADVAANIIFMTYLALMLGLGVAPIVKGGKKMVCHFGKCEEACA